MFGMFQQENNSPLEINTCTLRGYWTNAVLPLSGHNDSLGIGSCWADPTNVQRTVSMVNQRKSLLQFVINNIT